ncbi:unnamed protein product [Candida verbasci]|uniref:25S rRNA (uridine-N(3))-methyltransferase BMT5-like domain-containing protein n=1 Tax=Candida verbasci TaxID=1227364 RepID=A0A9W4TX23_9ASCO|nr:unnamed protein product [Candida verbasci]
MSRKLKDKKFKQKGLKGSLQRHIIQDEYSKQAAKNKEIDKENKANKLKSRKASKKSRQNNVQQKVKGLMPFKLDDHLLLIGEGDFSFAKSLIFQNFILPSNLIATSYDSKDELDKYPQAIENIKKLEELGVRIIYNVDATNLPTTLGLILNSKQKKAGKSISLFDDKSKIDYIMFNFPHSGKGIKDVDRNIRDHQKLILEYFQNCKKVFELINVDTSGYNNVSGKIILSLFEGEPYNSWGIKILGKFEGFKVEKSGKFEWDMFPEYHHRRTNSVKDTTKPANERDARMYIFEEFIKKKDED